MPKFWVPSSFPTSGFWKSGSGDNNPFLSLANTPLIFDARDQALADGATVSSVTNSAPLGTVTITGTGTGRPLWDTTGFGSAYPALQFDGSDDELLTSARVHNTGNSSVTVFAVFSPQRASGDSVCGFGTGGAGAGLALFTSTNQVAVGANGTDIYLAIGTIPIGQKLIMVARYQSGSPGTLYANVYGTSMGQSIGSSTALTANWGDSAFSLGQTRPGAFFYGQQNQSFLAVVNDFIADELMQDLVDYLMFSFFY